MGRITNAGSAGVSPALAGSAGVAPSARPGAASPKEEQARRLRSQPRDLRIDEGVALSYAPSEKLRELVESLHDPWIGDEGPTDAWFRHGLGGRDLLQRGIAFDQATTVVWDEDEVQIVERAASERGLIALRSDVLIRHGFNVSQAFERTDYLRDGTLVASRYSPKGENDA